MDDAAQAISNEVPETALKIYATGWVATIITSSPSQGEWTHVHCSTIGNTKELALEGAQHVLDVWANGRAALIRVRPEVASETSFTDKITRHAGCVRFSYKLRPGDWVYVEDTKLPFLLGEPH